MGADHQGRRNESGIIDVVPPMIPACLPPRDVTRPTERIRAGEMLNAGHLLELFQAWTPDRATQQRILVDNPAKLYGFPN